MIKPWLFEFLPELGNPTTEPEPHAVTAHFARYLDLWVRDASKAFSSVNTISAVPTRRRRIC
jgi:hypothetical protein